MEAAVLKTLQKIRKEAPRRFKDLRNICDDLIAVLSDQRIGSNDLDADKYFDPLQAACETKQTRLMEIALEGIKYLIDHGYLRGNRKISIVDKSNSDENTESKSTSERRTLMDLVIETVSKCAEEYDDNVHLQVLGVLLSAVTSQSCEVHEASLLLAVRSCFHIHLITKNSVNKTTAKAALTQILSITFFKMESFDARAKMETEAALASLQQQDKSTKLTVPCGHSMYPQVYGFLGYKPSGGAATPFAGFNSTAATIGHVFPTILHKDAFLIFRALCKLSMKNSTSDNGSTIDPIALQNKILSLELILHILEHSGPAFRSGDKFIFAIRQYLCVSLINNCTSQVTQVIGLSLQVFVALLNGFKDHLKAELEIFMTNIFLRILESENSTFDHKCRVLEVFHTICQDPAALVELFINYDCDFDAIDLFRRMIDSFAKITKNPNLSQSRQTDFIMRKNTNDEQILKMMGLEGLVIILRTLIAVGGPLMLSKTSSTTTTDQSNNGNIHKNQQIVDESHHSIDEDETNESRPYSRTLSSVADEVTSDGQTLMKSYDRKQKNQEEIETGILKFNLSPKKGLAYLASLGHIEHTPQGIAKFFHQYGEKMDKTAIGDYLGKEVEYEGGFCVKVLHEYVDMFDFENMLFDEAIRVLLSGFRLPGEAQKIDRIMEKFAERYYLQNRDIFASADMAFILAFSTIMLQTNLHTPAIRDDKRMTKEQFIKQNTGISADGELPISLLSDIYDRIAACPISLNQDEKLKFKKKEDINQFLVFSLPTMTSNQKRIDAYNDERKEMIRASEAIIKQKRRNKTTNKRHIFVRSQGDIAYITPMFEVAWAPMLSVFSQMLEMNDEEQITSLCLEGFQLSIRLSCRCEVITARDTYINSLTKFTTLEMIKEMKYKHIDGIKLLINIAMMEGDFLCETWGPILRCISHLSRLQLFGNGLHTDEMFFSDTPGNEKLSLSRRGFARRSLDLSQQNTLDPFKLFSTPSKAETSRLIEETNAELLLREIDPVLIDRIFLNSQNLSSESVLYFVRNLCQVSLEEISTSPSSHSSSSSSSSLSSMGSNSFKTKDSWGGGGDVMSSPRIFSLQKLVEVADFNMHSRPRLAWTQLWSVLAMHFTTVGVHENRALSMFAIDSLKQLSIKFLQKAELSNFNFQRLFLKPFEVMMNRSQSIEIKELILRCLDIMVLACAPNIRSGWRSIFAVFSSAASNEKQEIAGVAFEITERLMTQQFDLLIHDFVELMNCFVAFASGPHTLISLSALSYLSQCADHLVEGKVESALDTQYGQSELKKNTPNGIRSNVISEDAAVFRLWWPLLLGLSTRVADTRLQIRTRAVETLHRVLKTYGNLFSSQTWKVIFKGVLFPMIDSAKIDDTPQPHSQWPTQNPSLTRDPASWISTTASTALTVCVNLFIQYYEQGLTNGLLSDLITMFTGCINQDIESLSRLSFGILVELILQIPVDHQTNTLPSDVANLIATKLSTLGLSALKFDYGIAGTLTFDDKTVTIVKQLFNNTYNSTSGNGRDMRSIRGRVSENGSKRFPLVHTPYGIGKVVDETQSPAGITVQSIILSWGAMLYSSDSFIPVQRNDQERSMSAPKLTKEQEWSKLSYQNMASMVLSLDFIRGIGEILHMYYDSWSLEDLTLLLGTLQCFYDHARCFNSDIKLRTHLRSKKFMKFRDNPSRLPHLLEQETRSAAQLLVFGFRLYSEESMNSTGNARAQFMEPILKRIISNLFEKYILLDESSLTASDTYIQEELAAYAPPLMIAIKGIADFQKIQFYRNVEWVSPMLTGINICNDRGLRSCVKLVTENHINPILTSYSRSLLVNSS